MAQGDEAEWPVPRPDHAVGERLDALSVEELHRRVALLKDEIARLEAAAEAKLASRSAAEGFFRR